MRNNHPKRESLLKQLVEIADGNLRDTQEVIERTHVSEQQATQMFGTMLKANSQWVRFCVDALQIPKEELERAVNKYA